MFMKELHTALFVAPTGIGKTYLALDLLENEYFNHSDFIVIICPTLKHNETYKNRGLVWTDPEVIPIEPCNRLYYLIETVSNLLAGSKPLFLIDDIIADETLDKRCQSLLELPISGRHRGHSIWLLTQSYTAILRISEDKQGCFTFGTQKIETDLNTIHEKNDIIETEELANVKKQLKRGKHICLIMTMGHPRAYRVCNSFVTRLLSALLSRNRSTPVKRF